MTFPNLTPSSRSFTPGDFPIKKFQTANGKSIRMMYGNRRGGRTIDLTYENIADANAYAFVEDYQDKFGTLERIPTTELNPAFNGWGHTTRDLITGTQLQWRYAEPPQITSVRPGRSTVTVKLIGEV